MQRTGFVYSTEYLKHKTKFHPESSKRLEAIVDKLEQSGLLAELISIQPNLATIEQIAMVHSLDYIAMVKDSCRQYTTILLICEIYNVT